MQKVFVPKKTRHEKAHFFTMVGVIVGMVAVFAVWGVQLKNLFAVEPQKASKEFSEFYVDLDQGMRQTEAYTNNLLRQIEERDRLEAEEETRSEAAQQRAFDAIAQQMLLQISNTQQESEEGEPDTDAVSVEDGPETVAGEQIIAE